MSRVERVQQLVNDLRDHERYAENWLIGVITACSEAGNGLSDMQARRRVQEAVEAYEWFAQERTQQLQLRAMREAAAVAGEVPGEVYERDEPVPVVDPSTVVGWPVGGGR